MSIELYELLPPFGQALLTVGVVVVGTTSAWLGLRAKKPEAEDPRVIPMFILVGPVHDALQSVHGMSEQSRLQTTELKDIARILTAMDRGQDYTHNLLEAILRSHEMSSPPPRKRP